jgi:hypothetical protein
MNKLLQKIQEEANRDEFSDEALLTQFFGIEPQRKSPACLDLRLADNSFRAVPYSYIMEIEFEPTDGIIILTSTKRIKIEGRNLNLLYDYLVQFRVRYIQANIGADLAENDDTFISAITIKNLSDL